MNFSIPNQLTLFRFILTPIFYILILQPDESSRLWAGILFFLASLTDWYDGYFARRFGLVTRWGQFMDPLADKLLVSTALFVLAQLHYLMWWMVIVIILRDFMVTSLRIFALYIGRPIITSVIAKWKTFLQMAFIFALLIYLNIPGLPDIKLNNSADPWLLWSTLILSLIVILTLYSGIYYLIVNRAHMLELGRRILRLFYRKQE